MLTLLSHIYRIIWSVYKWLYRYGILKTRKLPYPVICVGNITTGGTGKTPAVIALTQILNKTYMSLRKTDDENHPSPLPSPLRGEGQGEGVTKGFSDENKQHVAILSRGYKRRSKDAVLVVSDGKSILSGPEDSGDEPYLIASTLKNVPVAVGADRYKSGIYSAAHTGANLFILDDGYQHLKLHRDINILLIDASNPLGNGHLLPKGILREPLSGIARADCVIITRTDEGNKKDVKTIIRKHNHDAPVFNAYYKATDITDQAGNPFGINIIKGKKVFIFAGIANPDSFRRSIRNAGGRIIGEMLYPDHYWYKEEDIRKIFKEASALSADAIVTTAKDAVRLHGPGLYDKSGTGKKLLILHVEMIIENGFAEWIKEIPLNPPFSKGEISSPL